MSFRFASRVWETSTSIGTGSIDVDGARSPGGFKTFASRFAVNERFYYLIQGRAGGTSQDEWEVGRGYLSDSNTIVRELVLESSNGDAAVNFSSGTKDVINDFSSRIANRLDPSNAWVFRKDFDEDNITFTALNSGGGTASLQSPVSGHPGILRLVVTNVADRCTVGPYNAGGIQTIGQVVGGGAGEVFWEWAGRVVSDQDGSHQWSFRFGMGDNNASADATNGIYFEQDRATYGDNNVRMCAANAGTRTKTTMGVSTTGGAWERWMWHLNAAGTSLQGYKNGVPQGTPVTTNITSNAMATYWLQLIKTLGAGGNRQIDTDYVNINQFLTTPR